ncbi:pilus assembly protein PilP [Stenoxybacter acetivorans]|uniref:pilus assembly protein PilP n=1 Tax=Stenoxybacter acetivorans TaxID=422441 RepID=UPI00055A6D15|nr:pilus assembly protein PilP [Stenoxybacter acetivorans]
MKKLLWLLPVCMGINACSAPHGDLQDWMKQTRAKATEKIKPPPVTENSQASSYTPPPAPALNSFNDARLRVGTTGANAPDVNRPKELLENFGLENLRYVGSIIRQGQAPTAFIEADNLVYPVKIGNYLGQNYGHISKITPDNLVITEQVEDNYGNWTTRDTEIPLSGE